MVLYCIIIGGEAIESGLVLDLTGEDVLLNLSLDERNNLKMVKE